MVQYIRQSKNYHTETAVHLLELQQGHSQCMLSSYKASPIVEFIVMSKNTALARFKLHVYGTYILCCHIKKSFVGFVFDQIFSKREVYFDILF